MRPRRQNMEVLKKNYEDDFYIKLLRNIFLNTEDDVLIMSEARNDSQGNNNIETMVAVIRQETIQVLSRSKSGLSPWIWNEQDYIDLDDFDIISVTEAAKLYLEK